MADTNLDVIASVQAGDPQALATALAAGAQPDAIDEHGWTALSWAAGRGDVDAIATLLEHGADVLHRGRDERAPYQIALGAAHAPAAELLRDAEDRVDPEARARRRTRDYCRAYPVEALAAFPDFEAPEPDEEDAGDAAGVLFLHEDRSVTRSMWHGEDVVFSDDSKEWAEFCERELCFRVPDDLELLPAPA